MRIGINARFLLPNKMEGFGWFTYEVVKRITIQHPEHEFILFFDRKYDSKFIFTQNITPIVLKPQARHPVLFKIWFNFSISRALKKYKIDLFFSPDGYLSLTTDVKQVAVIHDIYFEHFPNNLKKRDFKYLHSYFPKFAKKAERIITVSEFSKQDIVKMYGISPEKIDVAYNGASDEFFPITHEKTISTRAKWSKNNPYFLFVGALQPRKNLERLLQAFDSFKAETGSNYKLLIVGEAYFWSEEMKKVYALMKYKEDVIFCGHIQKEELVELMGAAEALTFVSYYEGFGIPIVEAMKCACPVLVGNKTASPEIAGDAALVCDPFDVISIKNALIQLSKDEKLKAALSQKGLKRA
jgi:glycosyltransferase involved in cell wall biosynthesis